MKKSDFGQCDELELTDRTLVSLMAAIIFSSCQGTTEGAVEKAEELLKYVEFPSQRPRKGKFDDVPF